MAPYRTPEKLGASRLSVAAAEPLSWGKSFLVMATASLVGWGALIFLAQKLLPL